jgi:hypothetical protein
VDVQLHAAALTRSARATTIAAVLLVVADLDIDADVVVVVLVAEIVAAAIIGLDIIPACPDLVVAQVDVGRLAAIVPLIRPSILVLGGIIVGPGTGRVPHRLLARTVVALTLRRPRIVRRVPTGAAATGGEEDEQGQV